MAKDTTATKGQQKKIEIITLSSHLLAKLGPNSVNFNTLSQRLKTNRAHIRYYFSDPKDIVLACFERLFETGQAVTKLEIKKSKSTEEKIGAYVRGAFHWYMADSERMTLMLLFFYHVRLNPKLQALHTRMRNEGLNRIVKILEESSLQKAEALRRGRLIQNLITGAIVGDATTESHSLRDIQRQTELACINIGLE